MQERLVMLVADDVDVNRASMRAMFEDEYEVIEAEDGLRAIDILHQRKIDVVILDVHMPLLDGAGVLGHMKADSALRYIPVIVKTARDENMELEMLEKGADDFIFSPSEPAIIKNRVRNIVQKYIFRQVMLQKKIEEEQHYNKVREKMIARVSAGMKCDIQEIQRLCEEAKNHDDEDEERFLEIEERAVLLMSRVEKLLKQPIAEHQEKKISIFPFQLRGVIEELTREYTAMCQKKGIQLNVKNCEIPYDNLVGDGEKLKMVWGRMIKNLYDNTPQGGSISTSYLQRVIGKNQIELEITVRGNIAPEDDFPIAKCIVELLRGSMIVEDEEGKGIVSVITIPFTIGKAPLVEQKKLANLKAILLDDSELMRQHHVSSLMRLGIECNTATNGANAIHLLRKAYMNGKGYDICFVNWYMVGAEDIIREIRTMIPQERMIIVCSTNEKEEIEDKMVAAGVDYIVERPICQSTLYRLLTDLCGGDKKDEDAE